jgi:predicted SAM-dependent methyltransferase
MESSNSLSGSLTEPGLHQVQRTWSPYSLLYEASRGRLRRLWASFGFNHDVASKVRYELDMVLLRSRCGLSPAYKRQVRDLARRTQLRVHLGCGNALLPGWINLDCYPPTPVESVEMLTLDLRRGLPIADRSVTALFSEHFLEHLPFETVRSVILPEIKRVLEPGGKIRIGIPNGEYFIDQYVAYRAGQRDQVFEENRHNKTPMTMLNEIAHGYGHYFVYDFETFRGMLLAAGFVKVRRCEPLDTVVVDFKEKDRVDPWRKAMTLIVEAESPADCQ